jgi:hypothetical protein
MRTGESEKRQRAKVVVRLQEMVTNMKRGGQSIGALSMQEPTLANAQPNEPNAHVLRGYRVHPPQIEGNPSKSPLLAPTVLHGTLSFLNLDYLMPYGVLSCYG